jgi:5-methylcytosine-specific restriction endonuclease McrA
MAGFRKKGRLSALIALWHEKRIRGFHHKPRWKRLRLRVFERYGRRCMRCETSGSAANPLCADHIKSLRAAWWLRWRFVNLQVLCRDCNSWKGSWNDTDFRPLCLERIIFTILVTILAGRAVK